MMWPLPVSLVSFPTSFSNVVPPKLDYLVLVSRSCSCTFIYAIVSFWDTLPLFIHLPASQLPLNQFGLVSEQLPTWFSLCTPFHYWILTLCFVVVIVPGTSLYHRALTTFYYFSVTFCLSLKFISLSLAFVFKSSSDNVCQMTVVLYKEYTENIFIHGVPKSINFNQCLPAFIPAEQ